MIDEATWTERMHSHTVRKADYRTPYDVDYSRVAHSLYYRKLAGKTQILSVSQDGDYHRTRLTHTIEVGQIALGLIQFLTHTEKRDDVRALLPSRALMETISAVHDIGHPPYGHGGEVALNYVMRDNGSNCGFEGNGQTLRILSRLLEGSSTRPGGNLTRRTLLGALKYPVPYSMVAKDGVMEDIVSPITGRTMLSHRLHEPPKCYLDTEQDVVQWLMAPLSAADQATIVATKAKSFDCTIMDLADDFAYGPGDLEDAVTLGLVTRDQLTDDIDPALWSEFLGMMTEEYPHDYRHLGGSRYDAFLDSLFGVGTKEQCGRLIHYMIANAYVTTRHEFEDPMYRNAASIRPAAGMLLKAIKKFVKDRVIRSPKVQQLRFKGQQMIIDLFALYVHDPRHLLPTPVWEACALQDDETDRMRTVCDFVASMTDPGMERAYRRLHSPGAGSVFDSLL